MGRITSSTEAFRTCISMLSGEPQTSFTLKISISLAAYLGDIRDKDINVLIMKELSVKILAKSKWERDSSSTLLSQSGQKVYLRVLLFELYWIGKGGQWR